MKKYLSLTLILGMMLTLLGIIPAEAKAYADYPYLYADFETYGDISSDGFNTTGKLAWSDEGAHGSNGALYVTQQDGGSGTYTDLFVPIKSNAKWMLTGPFKMSAWIKVDTTKTKIKDAAIAKELGFVLRAPALEGETVKSSWEFDWTVSADINQLNSGQWIYYEKIVTNWDGQMRHGPVYLDEVTQVNFNPRFGDVQSGKLSNVLAADSPTQSLCWYLDDLIVEPLKEAYVPVEATGAPLIDEDFSSGTYPEIFTSTASTYSTISDGCLVYENTRTNVYNQITTTSLPFKYNKIYRLSFRAKANDADSVGSIIKVYANRKQAARHDANDTFAEEWFSDAMNPNTNASGTLTTDWQNFELYMTRQVKAAYHNQFQLNIRCTNAARQSNMSNLGKEPTNFSIDDILLEELPTVANGDFEWLKTDVVTSNEDNNVSDNDSKLYGTFYGWRQNGATVEASQDKPAASEGTQSAKITVNTANGYIEQGVHIPNNSEREIKFWAKGEGDSIGKTIQVKLDRTVATKDSRDVYPIDDVQLLNAGTLTGEWQEFTIPYALAVAKPDGANDYAEPRSPFMSFVVDGGAAGMVYYVDDVTFDLPDETTAHPEPYATDLSIAGDPIEGETLLFDYTFNSDEGLAEGNSVVRVLKDLGGGKYITLAQIVRTGGAPVSFTIPESATDSKLRFEVMPVTVADSEEIITYGAIYATTSDTIKKAQVIEPVLNSFDAASSSITGRLYVENNVSGAETLNLVLIVVVCDENGGLINYGSKAISVADANSGEIALAVSTVVPSAMGVEVAYAKAYVWGFSGELLDTKAVNEITLFDSNMVSYAEPVVLEK